MGLFKIATSEKEISAYNNEYKNKAGASNIIASAFGGVAGAGLVQGIAKKMGRKSTILENVIGAGLGTSAASMANHYRVHMKMDEKIRHKLATKD